MHEVRTQDAHLRRMHPRYQAMRLEADVGVDAMWSARLEDPSKCRARCVGLGSTVELMLISSAINQALGRNNAPSTSQAARLAVGAVRVGTGSGRASIDVPQKSRDD